MIELKKKNCLICGKEFFNRRNNGKSLGDTQFLVKKFCSITCFGINDRSRKRRPHSDDWKRKMSERLREEHRLGLRKNIFTKEVRAKMSISAKNKPPMSEETRRKLSCRRGENSNGWKGDNVGYCGLHMWVRKQLGKPSKCEHCKDTTKKKYEWASKNHSYKRDQKEWLRLCTSCHRRYDMGLGVKIN